jgi:hypothetical protein
MGLGDEVELAIFVREAGAIVAGISPKLRVKTGC